MKIKNTLFILFIGIGLTFTMCKKEDDSTNNDDGLNETTYLIDKITTNNNEVVSVYSYNSDKLVSKIVEKFDYTALVQIIKSTYSNGKISKEDLYWDSKHIASTNYYYSNNLDSAIIYMIDSLGATTKWNVYEYEYNGNGRLVKFYDTWLTLPAKKYEFTYTGDNVTSLKKYVKSISAPNYELEFTNIYEYDNKINPYRNVGLNNLDDNVKYISMNNVIKLTQTDGNGQIVNNESYVNGIVYNSNNLISKITQEKLDSAEDDVFIISYRSY